MVGPLVVRPYHTRRDAVRLLRQSAVFIIVVNIVRILCDAVGGAEIKLMVLVSNAAVRPVGQDGHPAHGISHLMQYVALVRG
nr:hypothetical protein [Escherichia coli]